MRLLLALLLLSPLAVAAQPKVGASQPVLVAAPASGPPAAPFVGPAVEYAYDDGEANITQGPPSSFDPDMLWGNSFATQPGGETITEIAVAFGDRFPSHQTGPVTFWLLDDPDGDFDPRTGAMAVASVQFTPTVFGNEFVRVPIPPTTVSSHFFVGASAQLQGGEDAPARIDTDASGARSWFFYAPDIAAVIDTLGAAPFGSRMDDPQWVIFPGAFMVRAGGRPAGTSSSADDPSAASPALALAGPHPTRGAVALRVTLPAAGDARLDVLDALGRRVARLADGAMGTGAHVVRWDASRAAAGVYVARLTAGGASRSVRIVVATP